MKKHLYWLSSYPKSGNTWFRIFLSNYLTGNIDIDKLGHLGTMSSSKRLVKTYNTKYKRYFEPDELTELRREAYVEYNKHIHEDVYNKVHDAYLTINNEFMFPEESSSGVIYFIRHPYDVAVSFSNHMGFSLDTSIKRMNQDKFHIGGAKKQLKQEMFSWSGHIKSWTEQKGIPVLVMRYEDMLNDTFNTFSDSVKFLGLDYDEDKIKKSIEFSSFDKMKSIEEEKGFKEKPDKSEKFFAVGKAGYGADILTQEQKDLIWNKHKDIMIKYNYEK